MELALVFDIDGTLTPPRERLLPEMVEALQGLNVPFHVAAGSDLRLVQPQFLDPLWELGYRGDFEAFLNNGSAHFRCRYSTEPRVDKLSEFNFADHFGEEDHAFLLRTVEEVLDDDNFRFETPLRVIGERLVDRGSMLNVTPIGRPRSKLGDDAMKNRKCFARFDRETRYRRRMLEVFQARLARIQAEKDLLIMLGGETSFDFVVAGMDKTHAIRTLLAEGYERLVFLGDALFEGGNDSVISDFIAGWDEDVECPVEAIQVDGWQDTIRALRRRGWLET